MMFPLDYWDISILIAVITIILLVSSEILSSYSGKVRILVDKRKLRIVATALTAVFLIIVAMRIINIII
jgi:hypothetical protein